MRAIIVVILTVLTSGCTSMFKVMTDDPVRATNISTDKDRRDAVATISLDASRRNVIVMLAGEHPGRFCAEPPPDTANAIESILEATAQAQGQSGEKKAQGGITAKDAYKSNVVVVAKRTELLDIYRTGTYALCQYFLNGAVDDAELGELFQQLTDKVLLRVPAPTANEKGATDQ
jgi:hypothetical protein